MFFYFINFGDFFCANKNMFRFDLVVKRSDQYEKFEI